MTNREQLTSAIRSLCVSQHMYSYALELAMNRLSIIELCEVYDAVADHHDLVGKMARVLDQGVDVDLSRLRPARDPMTGKLNP